MKQLLILLAAAAALASSCSPTVFTEAMIPSTVVATVKSESIRIDTVMLTPDHYDLDMLRDAIGRGLHLWSRNYTTASIKETEAQSLVDASIGSTLASKGPEVNSRVKDHTHYHSNGNSSSTFIDYHATCPEYSEDIEFKLQFMYADGKYRVIIDKITHPEFGYITGEDRPNQMVVYKAGNAKTNHCEEWNLNQWSLLSIVTSRKIEELLLLIDQEVNRSDW